jgi:DNA-binding protein HU-beta
MNKEELVERISAQNNITKTQADAILTSTLNTIMETVAAGEQVRLIGFGIFEAAEAKARVGYLPHKKESVAIPATRRPKFTPGTGFKKKVTDTQAEEHPIG